MQQTHVHDSNIDVSELLGLNVAVHTVESESRRKLVSVESVQLYVREK